MGEAAGSDEEMTIYVNKNRSLITYEQNGEMKQISCSCWVRNELNGERKPTELVKSIPSGEYYYPRVFPSGRFKVTERPIHRNAETDPYTAPFFIPTDAGQDVDIWNVKNGAYDSNTYHTVWNTGYGLNFSTIPTTLGGIRLTLESDLLALVAVINKCFDAGEDVFVEVSTT